MVVELERGGVPIARVFCSGPRGRSILDLLMEIEMVRDVLFRVYSAGSGGTWVGPTVHYTAKPIPLPT